MTRSVSDQLEDALAALPTEPDEIARVFTELGIKGRAEDSCCCPVANYLKAETGRLDVAVGHFDVCASAHEASLPDHVAVFIQLVDNGVYPQLMSGRLYWP